MTSKGKRVGAMLSADKATRQVNLLGYGVYVDDEVPPPDINPALNVGIPNPKIVLDNGEVVWGMECWWGSENWFRELMASYEKDGWTIVEADIDVARAKVATKQ